MPAPCRADRARFVGLTLLSVALGWLSWYLGVLASFETIIDWVHMHLAWPLEWATGLIPPTIRFGSFSYEIGGWASWGPGDGALWWNTIPMPFGTWWSPLIPDGPNGWLLAPVWILIGTWHVGAVMLARSLWDRRGPLRRNVANAGHMFYAGRFELTIAIGAGLIALPLFALWRFERALWEAAILAAWSGGASGPMGTFQLNYRAFEFVLLVQIALIHWLIVWCAAKHALRYEAQHAQTTPKPSDKDQCPWCGYEHTAPRCPECGNDPANPGKARIRISLGWIDRTPWLRWIFRAPTGLALVAALLFSPIWLPHAHYLIAIL